MVIVLRIIILIVIILISLSVYKLISWQLKKQLLKAERINKESKTEEERQKSLTMLKKKNIKRSIVSFFLFIVCLSIILFVILLFIAKARIPKQFPQAEYDQACELMYKETADCVDSAKKEFGHLTSKYSVYPEIWYHYAYCCQLTGDYNTAIKAYNKAAELYENSVLYDDKIGLRNDALVSIGEVHLLRHDVNSAKVQFEHCLSIEKNKDMILSIAATFIRLGYVKECEQYFTEKEIKLDELEYIYSVF